jgi:class 3 adenylate cyclase
MDCNGSEIYFNWLIVALVSFNIAGALFTFLTVREKRASDYYTLALSMLLVNYSLIIASVQMKLYMQNINLFFFGLMPTACFGPTIYLFVRSHLHDQKKIEWRSLGYYLAALTGVALYASSLFHPDAEKIAIVQSYADRHSEKIMPLDIGIPFFALLLELAGFYITALLSLVLHLKKSTTRKRKGDIILLLVAAAPNLAWMIDMSCILFNLKFNNLFMVLALCPFYTLLLFKNSVIQRALQDELSRQKEDMMRFLPENLVARIQSDRSALQLVGERGIATVMFCDIRGFTTISETLDAMEVTTLLNEYFSEMNQVIFAHNGTINKYVGDAIIAVFGLLDQEKDLSDVSLKCAHAMLERLDLLNERWKEKKWPEINIGIGLHRGQLIHGNIGSPQRMEYTVIGDTVNIASRIADLNSRLGVRLLFTQEILESVHEPLADLKNLGEFDLKGKNNKVRLFTQGPLKNGSHLAEEPGVAV